MKPMLKALYNGELRPMEQIVSSHPEYRILNQKISEGLRKWKERLPKAEFEQLEKLLEMRVQSHEMDKEAAFVHGYQLGARLLAEAVCSEHGKGGICKKHED
ncbi:DUF6809 family protein [Paenibacillus sp. 1P07SE]|uniref:DUF6809 family protein n=1 Tax=Paenibacillus sp. 1P07SE TaxID=3132209 RepID=UPI0039A4C180